MIHKALFNNGITQLGMITTFARGDATVNDLGQALANTTPRYSSSKFLLPAPTMQIKKSGISDIKIWSGRSLDGIDPTLLELWFDGSLRRTGICFDGAYPPDLSRVKSLGSDFDLGVESLWIH